MVDATSDKEVLFPKEENLGRNCQYWNLGLRTQCGYPKAEMIGRTSCEGIIDDVCLFLKDGREPISLTEEQQAELRNRIPDLGDKFYIPPGEIM